MVIRFVKPNGDELKVGRGYDWRLQKKGLDGFASFEGKTTTTSDYARDGGTIENVRLDSLNRTIKICNINWRNADVVREQAKKFFTYNTLYKIYITNGGETKWAEGLLYRMAINEPTNEDYLLKLTMSFAFENPYLLSVDDFGRDIASLLPNAGFPFISRINYGTAAGIFNFDRAVTLRNDGDNIAYPKIRIKFTGDVLNPVVSINEGFIRFLGTFSEHDVIVIDYTKNPPRIERNGENILGLCDRASDFDSMYIMIGDNTASFDADNGTDEMSVSVFYNRQYTMI